MVAAAPSVCRSPGPIGVPALTGFVNDAATGAKVKHLSVSVVNPTTGQADPGPMSKTGKFIDQNLGPGTWAMAVAAPGYSRFSGVLVTKNPGPKGSSGPSPSTPN